MRRFVVGLALTALSVGLLVKLIAWQTVWGVLQSADERLIVLAILCLVLSLVAKTARWRLLLPDDSPVATPRLYRILHISFLLNNVLPARLGDVARIALASRQPGLRFGSVLSSLLTERVTDTVTLLACFVAISPFLPIPSTYEPWLHAAWTVLAAAVVITVAGYFLRDLVRRSLFERVRLPLPGALRAETASFRDGLRLLFARRHVLLIWGWSAGAWAGAFAINWFLMAALHIHTPMAVAVLLTCTTNLAMLLPSSPGYVGVFHAAATLTLMPFHVEPSAALSFAILAHLVNVLPVSILGALFLLLGRESISFDLRRARAANDSGTPGAS
ncbi:MAG: flippase-like domain-containing protein [Dehalococcoidia bacterium]|nr:flippase-like domain-containing protein [Dehalococcoidia bacterium]